MNALDIIVKKRDGAELTPAEIRFFVEGFVRGEIPDYQVAAWAMAVYFRGMTDVETAALTVAMADSGDRLDLHVSLPPGTVIVDKHSSGGVGDKTTLVVAPIVAACGLPVGKMSGRGLSFSGGTIDKLESIAGWSPDLSEAQFRRQLQSVGLVIAGQTLHLAPADRQLYALRDVTGTVPSLPLIASSIMSKKLAAGADAIVLDVKAGRGAFMATQVQAKALARLMVAIGEQAGRRMSALITQMDQPLGRAVGNSLEVKEALATLHGDGPADFTELVTLVASEMLALGRTGLDSRAGDSADSAAQEAAAQEAVAQEAVAQEAVAQEAVAQAIRSGAALGKFREFIAAQGGDVRMVDEPQRLPVAPVIRPVTATQGGYVHEIDARAIGLSVVALGGGRRRKGDGIDPRVGIVLHAKVGDRVEAGAPLCEIHAATELAADAVAPDIGAAFHLSEDLCSPLPIVCGRVRSTRW